MPKPTVYDICAQTGFSTATVSRVLNDTGRVSSATRAKVLQAARALRYRPSFAARSLARQRSDLVGALFPRIASMSVAMSSGFFVEILCGVADATKEAGFHLVTAFSHEIADQRDLAERFVRQSLVGALIIVNLHLDDDFLDGLCQEGVPIVSLDRATTTTSSVSIDNSFGVQQLLTYFAGCGHRRLALLMGPLDTHDAIERLEASVLFAPLLGIDIPKDWRIPGDFSEEGAYAAIRRYLAEGATCPPAIFAFNDLMALGAMRAIREAGLRVPEDVSVAGYDDIGLAKLFDLTTVQVPMNDLGRAAAQLALDHLNGSKAIVKRKVEPRLIVRGSLGRVPVREPVP